LRKPITYLATQINSFTVEGAGFGSLIRVYAKARHFFWPGSAACRRIKVELSPFFEHYFPGFVNTA
jgi:hypothetical protein